MCRLTILRDRVRDAVDRPNGVSVYVFGSTLKGQAESDIDLLFVYDPRKIFPRAIYTGLRPFVRRIEASLGASVHPVVLTIEEERDVGFIESESCVLIAGGCDVNRP